MTSDRAMLERQMSAVDLRPFTLEDFHRRRRRQQRNRRIGITVMGVALAAAAIGSVLGTVDSDPVDETVVAGVDGPFLGSWRSAEVGGPSKSMEIQLIGPDGVEVVIHDDAAVECSGAPATLNGTGQVGAEGTLVVAAELACDDDGRRLPLTIEFTHDPVADALFGLDVAWRRPAVRGSARSVTELPESLEELEPGAYFIDPDGDASTPLLVTYEVAAEGWSPWIGAAKFQEGGHTALSITTVDNLVRQACNDDRPAEPPVGPTVEDLATALTQLAPFEVTAPPSDVTVFGYEGTYLELRVPDLPVTGEGNDRHLTNCLDGELHSWIAPNLGGSFWGYNNEPGRTEQFWILDVDGTRLVIETNQSPESPPQDIAELQTIFDSIQIHP